MNLRANQWHWPCQPISNSCSQPHWACQPVSMPSFGSKLLVRSGPLVTCGLIIPNAPAPGPSPNPRLSRPVRTHALNSFFQEAHHFFTPVRSSTFSSMSAVWRRSGTIMIPKTGTSLRISPRTTADCGRRPLRHSETFQTDNLLIQ